MAGKKINHELDEELLKEGIKSLLKYEENKEKEGKEGNILENYSKPIFLQVNI